MNQNTKRQMAAGMIFSCGLIIAKLLTGIVYTPLVLKILGQSQYGVYSLAVSFAGYLTIFDAGANAGYVRFYVQAKAKDNKSTYPLNMFFLILFLGLAILATIAGFIISRNSVIVFGEKITSNEYILIKKSLNLLSISLFFEVFGCLWRSMIIANEKFVMGKLLDLVVYLSMPIVTVPLLLRGYDCSYIIFVRMVIRALELIIEMMYCLFILKERFSFVGINKALIITIFQFVSFIVLQSIMDQLNWQIDKFILSRTQGTAEISLYSVGTTINNIYMTVSASIAGVFIAEANRLVALKKKERLESLFIKTSRMCTYVTLLIMIEYSLLGLNFIRRWAGEGYAISYVIGFLLMFPLTFSLCLGIGQDITRAKNKHQLQIILDFLICIVNVIVSIPLAIKWGAVGSAIGTFASELILCCIIQPIYYHKVVGLNMVAVYKNLSMLLKGCIFPILYGIFIRLFGFISDSYTSVVLHGIAIAILYCGSMYAFSFDEYDKEIVCKMLRKGRKDNI